MKTKTTLGWFFVFGWIVELNHVITLSVIVISLSEVIANGCDAISWWYYNIACACYHTTMSTTTHNLAEFEQQARMFADSLEAQKNEATIVTLSGDLGAGKTTWVQIMAKELGVEGIVTSPTFVIMKEYELPPLSPADSSPQAGEHGNGGFSRLIHIDAYRLENGEELRALGWEEWAQDSNTLIIIEWPERVPELVQQNRVTHEISIAYVSDNERTIEMY